MRVHLISRDVIFLEIHAYYKCVKASVLFRSPVDIENSLTTVPDTNMTGYTFITSHFSSEIIKLSGKGPALDDV